MAILARCPESGCKRMQSNKNKKCANPKCGIDLVKAKRSGRVKYYISYIVPGTGKQRREVVGYSIEEARAAEGKRKAQKFENPRVLEKAPEEKMTFQQLAGWYLGLSKVQGLAYYPILKINLRSFNRVFGAVVVGQVKPADLENYQTARKAEGLSDAYVDQELAAAKTMVNRAFDNDMVTGETVRSFKRVKKLLKKNSNARDRVLSQDEYQSLMAHLSPHVKPVVAMGYYTGMRRGEILSLTWDKVDMKKKVIRLEATDTKDGEPRNIPILDELYEVLSGMPRGLHDAHVFLYRGKPIKSIRIGLMKACEKAGIKYGRKEKDGFTFHDLRHTANTNMRKAGVPESVIMRITGHSTREMFDRYNSIDDEDAREAMEKMGLFLASVDQTVDQPKNGK